MVTATPSAPFEVVRLSLARPLASFYLIDGGHDHTYISVGMEGKTDHGLVNANAGGTGHGEDTASSTHSLRSPGSQLSVAAHLARSYGLLGVFPVFDFLGALVSLVR